MKKNSINKLIAFASATVLAAGILAGCAAPAQAPAQEAATQAVTEAAATETTEAPAEAATQETGDVAIPAPEGDDNVIHVGAVPTPHAEVLEQVADNLKEAGWELDIVVFNDYILPNQALTAKELDANYFQHLPYLDDYNAQNGTDLVSVQQIHFEPLGIYAGKSDDLANVQDGATFAIPNDTTNEARALLLLQDNGLITLKDGVGLEATPLDIAENPHNLKFTELEAAQTSRAIEDVDFAVVNGNYAIDAKIKDRQVAVESAESEAAQTYANLLVVRAGEEESVKTQALKAVLNSDEVRDFINNTYDGAVLPVF